MVKLLQYLFAAFPALIASLFVSMGRKWVTLTAALTAWVAITLAFIASINVCLGELATTFTAPSWIGNAIGMFVPSNFGAVLGCIVSAQIARAAYLFATGKVKMFVQAT